jgi:putative membrane protein
MMHWGNFGGMGFGFGWIFMILFWLLVILGIVYILKNMFSSRVLAKNETAEDILKKRYAAGEITKSEFNERRLIIAKRS